MTRVDRVASNRLTRDGRNRFQVATLYWRSQMLSTSECDRNLGEAKEVRLINVVTYATCIGRASLEKRVARNEMVRAARSNEADSSRRKTLTTVDDTLARQ